MVRRGAARGTAYEEFIGATGCVPTRDNLHDFFNGLVWQSFPLVKRQLNALQAAQIAVAGVGKSRGPARDAATIFDENAALLVVRDLNAGRALVDDLRAHRWHEALFARRALFGSDVQVWLFGGALMEKRVAPRKAITAHARVVWVDAGLRWRPMNSAPGATATWPRCWITRNWPRGALRRCRCWACQAGGRPGRGVLRRCQRIPPQAAGRYWRVRA